MNRDDDELLRRIGHLGFDDEPPMESEPADDVARGRRRLRRQRLGWGSGMLGMTAVLALGLLANPFAGPGADSGLPVAGPEVPEPPPPTKTPGPTEPPPPTEPPSPTTASPDGEKRRGDELPYPNTRRLLLDKAVEHLDPAGQHLPSTSTGFTGGYGDGAAQVGTKLSWTVPGEDGMGMVLPIVTTHDYPADQLQLTTVCPSDPSCERVPVPGGEGKAWVSDRTQSVWSVTYERPDGSVVGLEVHERFGNNSETGVSEMDIVLADALAFVADADLRVVSTDQGVDPGPTSDDDN